VVAVARLAQRLRLDPAVLEGYEQRAHTRSDHLRLVADYLGWKIAPEAVLRSRIWSSFAGPGDGARPEFPRDYRDPHGGHPRKSRSSIMKIGWQYFRSPG
jgi:hypothetical protein